jgi:hypothetical protein
VGDFGDGRLELDELGSVIDHASSLDAPRRDDLLEGSDAVTWTERLESAGLTPWLRRHRVALAATTAVLLVAGVATTAYLRSRPPAQDMTVSASVNNWVSDISNGSGVLSSSPGMLASTYRATPGHPGDTLRILGVVGPGIRASTAHPLSDHAAEDGSVIADVTAVVGCDDPTTGAATANDFRLRIEQTDVYGRATTGLVDLPLVDAGQWVDSIVPPCVQQQLTELVPATATRITADIAARVITVDASVRNSFGRDLSVSGMTGSETAVYVASTVVFLPRSTAVVIPVHIRVTDCVNPRIDDAYIPDPTGSHAQPPVAGINLFAAISGQEGYGGSIVMPFSASQQATVSRLFAQMCIGVPPATVTVLVAGNAPAAVVGRFHTGGDPSIVGLRTWVDVATSAQHAEISDGTAPEDIANGAAPTIVTASSAVRGGHARLVVDWAAPCSYVQSPPTVTLTLTSGSHSWPTRATLSDQHLIDAYRVACPALQPGDFGGMGWTTS